MILYFETNLLNNLYIFMPCKCYCLRLKVMDNDSHFFFKQTSVYNFLKKNPCFLNYFIIVTCCLYSDCCCYYYYYYWCYYNYSVLWKDLFSICLTEYQLILPGKNLMILVKILNLVLRHYIFSKYLEFQVTWPEKIFTFILCEKVF